MGIVDDTHIFHKTESCISKQQAIDQELLKCQVYNYTGEW